MQIYVQTMHKEVNFNEAILIPFPEKSCSNVSNANITKIWLLNQIQRPERGEQNSAAAALSLVCLSIVCQKVSFIKSCLFRRFDVASRGISFGLGPKERFKGVFPFLYLSSCGILRGGCTGFHQKMVIMRWSTIIPSSDPVQSYANVILLSFVNYPQHFSVVHHKHTTAQYASRPSPEPS